MQPNGPRHFVDIAPPPPRPPRPMVPAQPPNVTKIPVNIDPPKQPAVLPQFTPLTQVQPQPMPTVQPQAVVPQPTTPPAEPPKFGALQSKVDAHPLFSGSKEKAPNKPRGFVAKLMWLLAILLVLLAGVYVVIDSGAVNTNINLPFHIFKQSQAANSQPTITPTQSVSNLKSIVYNNSKGQSFNMKFYDQFSLKPPLGTTSGIHALVSKTSLSNKAPLTIFIATIEGTAIAAQASYDRYKDCGLSFPLVLSAVNSYISQTIKACRVSLEPPMYVAVFTSGMNKYIATISQDTDWSKSSASSSSAQSALSSLDLSVYDNDIKAILSSIQPV